MVGGVVILFTPWCSMVLQAKISSHHAGLFEAPLPSIGGGLELHASLPCRPSGLYKYLFWNVELVNPKGQ